MTHTTLVITRGDGTQREVLGYQFSAEKLQGRKSYAASRQIKKLPPKVDLRPFMTTIENQQNTNSCVANAVAGAYEYLIKKHTEKEHDISRMFVYYNARYLGEIEGDKGSFIADAIEGLRQYGACLESTWPFELDLLNEEPSDDAYEEAANFVVEDMQLVPVDLMAWKTCLAEGYPIIFGISLFESFDKHRQRGMVPAPTPSEVSRKSHGGHAMLCVGYSDTDKLFIVRNSWGNQWGDAGYCYIPYDYLINPRFNSGDSWIIRQLENFEFDQADWGDEESIVEDFDTELAKMSEEDYSDLLDALGDHPLELRLALIFLVAAGADEDLGEDELEEISNYLQTVMDSLGVETQVKKLLQRALNQVGDEDLLEESIELLGEYLSKTMLASIVTSLTEIVSTDELDENEEDFIATLVQAWQIEESETEDEESEDEEDEDEDDEDSEDDDEDEDDEESSYYIATRTIKVYEEADRQSSVLATLAKGDEVEFLEEEDEDWWYVSTEDEIEGYVQCQYLEESEEEDDE